MKPSPGPLLGLLLYGWLILHLVLSLLLPSASPQLGSQCPCWSQSQEKKEKGQGDKKCPSWSWLCLKCLWMGLSFMNTFIGVCGVSPGIPASWKGWGVGGGQAERQMHAILLGLSRNVLILILKDVSWGTIPNHQAQANQMVGHLSVWVLLQSLIIWYYF